jgi:hypothetical protein
MMIVVMTVDNLIMLDLIETYEKNPGTKRINMELK